MKSEHGRFGDACSPAESDVAFEVLNQLKADQIGRRGFLGLFSTASALLVAGCGAGGAQTSGSAIPAAVPVTIPNVAPEPPPVATPSPTDIVTERKASSKVTAPPRILATRPPTLSQNVITVDLTRFNPALPFPGWDGKAPSQSTTGRFPIDRDLLILGHATQNWVGGGFIRGGRNVHWIGGTYRKGPWLRNFVGDACMEGILTRAPFSAVGAESGDSFSINPDSTTLATSRVYVLNCRAENIDGYFDASHGDCFQLAPHHAAPNGYSSTPREVIIERMTGTTGYQGLFLAAQHFDPPELGYTYKMQKLTLIDVNLRKTRSTMLNLAGVRGTPNLIFMISIGDKISRGDMPYEKVFRNVFVEPAGSEGIDGCIFPNSTTINLNLCTKTKMKAILSADKKTATYPPEMMLDGSIQLGPPREGDFARAANEAGEGGLDVPGRGYISPGYAT